MYCFDYMNVFLFKVFITYVKDFFYAVKRFKRNNDYTISINNFILYSDCRFINCEGQVTPAEGVRVVPFLTSRHKSRAVSR